MQLYRHDRLRDVHLGQRARRGLQPRGQLRLGGVSLDLDMVSAVCPDCNMVLVEASSNGHGELGVLG